MSATTATRRDAVRVIRRQRPMSLSGLIDHCERQEQEAPDAATARAFARLRWELTVQIPETVA